MKTFLHSLLARPWLLVVLAFAILLGAWASLISVSSKVPHQRLSAEEETRLLERRSAP